MPGDKYALGYSGQELERLTAQHRLFGPFTRDLFARAGLAPGMRVLDIGSGAGDVALLASEFVGPQGSVLGIDRGAPAVQRASARAQAAGAANVRFVEADLGTVEFDQPFDAIVGRFVLMYMPDPGAVLGRLTRFLRSGGIVAFQEMDMTTPRAVPPSPVFAKTLEWMHRAFEHAKVPLDMAMRLHPAFVKAGLPPPEMQGGTAVVAGDCRLMCVVVAELIRSLLPLIEKFGIATAEQVDIDSLEQRLIDDVTSLGSVVAGPLLVGAWSRRGT